MTPLSCEAARFLTSRALDGDLSDSETRRLAEHLADCEACRAHASTVAAVARLTNALNQQYQAFSLGDDFIHKVEAAVRVADPQRRVSLGTDMPEEDLRRFNRCVANDPVLQDRLKAAPDLESFVTLYVRLGGELGFRFTGTDLKRLIGTAANDRELSDGELDAVVGGTGAIEQILNSLLNS